MVYQHKCVSLHVCGRVDEYEHLHTNVVMSTHIHSGLVAEHSRVYEFRRAYTHSKNSTHIHLGMRKYGYAYLAQGINA